MNTKNYDADKSIAGGVIPDIYVKSGVYPALLVKFISRGLFFKFSRELISNGVKIDENFTADKKIIKTFKKFLNKNNIEYKTAEFDKEIKTIKYEIEKDVLSNKFSTEKGLAIFLKSDPVSQKGVEHLKLKLNEIEKEKNNAVDARR
jgi:hypothetical protein